ncbi:MAG: hypothetical protein RR910_08120 [Acidaminococcaceae bacterium]
MRNTLGDLNNHLFEQLERLNDIELEGEALAQEIKRSETVTKIAATIIDNASLILKAKIVQCENMPANSQLPTILEGGK